MRLPKSEATFARVFGHESIDSTNLELGRILSKDLPEFTAVISAEQSAGQGRLGRRWQSPAGASLALSVLIRPQDQAELSWLTLIAGLSVSDAARELGVNAGVKWPNDVLVSAKKLCGILAVSHGDSVVLGMGVNIREFAGQLPTAIALSQLGVEVELDDLAAAVGSALKSNVTEFRADPAKTKQRFSDSCITLGESVRAELPDGSERFGVAREVNDFGQLVILTPEPLALSAADVWHLRN